MSKEPIIDALRALDEIAQMAITGRPERNWVEVKHPDFKFVSVPAYTPGLRATPDGSEVEVAFFTDEGEWFNGSVDGFDQYADCEPGTERTRIFEYVPRALVEALLAKYKPISQGGN